MNPLFSALFIALLVLPLQLSAEQKRAFNVTRDVYYADASRPDRELQSLDVYWQDKVKKRPVIIYIHGGGWAFGDKREVNYKPDFFVPQGFAFVSMNYRLQWDYKLYDQLEDVAKVVKWVRTAGEQYGLDASKVMLMGHESGAHLAALVSTDPRYLRAQGLSLNDIRAVVAIDTISYDIPRVMKELGTFVQRRQHKLVFGETDSAQRMASPISHVGNPGTPQFALMYLPGQRPSDEVSDASATPSATPSSALSSELQAQGFARALTQAGVHTLMIPGNPNTNQSVDVELGRPGDRASGALMAFIRASL